MLIYLSTLTLSANKIKTNANGRINFVVEIIVNYANL